MSFAAIFLQILASLKSTGHITEAVAHFNNAIDGLGARMSMVEVSHYLFDALNKIQTEWMLSESDQSMGEVKAFQTMILKGLDSKGHSKLLNSEEIGNIVSFEPQTQTNQVFESCEPII